MWGVTTNTFLYMNIDRVTATLDDIQSARLEPNQTVIFILTYFDVVDAEANWTKK